MSERGIIMSAPMVRALLGGRKSQTRRIIKVPGIMGGRYPIMPPEEAIELEDGEFRRGVFHYASTGALSGPYKLPYASGDRLWVRETWSHTGSGVWDIATARMMGRGGVIYRCDGAVPGAGYLPSIHMPREFSRLTLTVTDVRVQRVQEISEADAMVEGLLPAPGGWWSGAEGQASPTPVGAYALLWNSLHAKPGERWNDNPWIVAVSFDTARRNIDLVAP